MDNITINQFPVIEYDPTEAAIADLKVKYMPLTIAGLDDRKGYKVVDEARKHVKSLRCAVENRRKGLKAPAVEWGKAVDNRAKELTAALQPIEDHLAGEQKRIDDEKARIAAEVASKIAAMVKERVEALAKYGFKVNPDTARAMTEEGYQADLATAKAGWEAEQAQKERERQAREAEEARLAQVAKEQAEKDAALKAEAQRQAAEAAQIEREKKALEEEKRKTEEKPVQPPVTVENPPVILAPALEVKPIPVVKAKVYPHIWLVVGDDGHIYLGVDQSREAAECRAKACRNDQFGEFEVVEYGPVGLVRS